MIEKSNKTNFFKWLFYTVIVGALPAFIRLLGYYITSGEIELFYSGDLITLGLVLHVSMINEIEDLDESRFALKTPYNGLSVVFIVFYGFLLSHQTGIMLQSVDSQKVLEISFTLSSVSLLMGIAMFALLQYGGRND